MPSSLRQAFTTYVGQTSTSPDGLEVVSGHGIYLVDAEGRSYMDGISGIAVSSLGHHHPEIIRAIKAQLDLHLHTMVYGEHIQAPQVSLAKKLAEILPSSLNSTFFVNSGAEAVEGALKLARKYTSRYEIIACRNAYHGSTAGAESLRSDHEHTFSSMPLVPGIRHIEYNNIDDLDAITTQTASIVIEPIQGEAGVILPAPGYLQAVRERCNQTGTLLIFDEIQTGMGRTGTMWAFEHENVIPDILLVAKAFGGGLPLGAFIAAHHIMSVLSHDPPLEHLTTFGGHPLSCAASLAAIEVIQQEKLYEQALQRERTLRDLLNPHSKVKEIRGRGLMLAIELADKDHLLPAVAACRKEGLLVDWFLFNQQSIRLAPPLIINDEETRMMGEKILAALDSI
jgi:acetylornithine/succinyldiaminopimelate/putrescine aminotransferase